jgi:hypothetical protein
MLRLTLTSDVVIGYVRRLFQPKLASVPPLNVSRMKAPERGLYVVCRSVSSLMIDLFYYVKDTNMFG